MLPEGKTIPMSQDNVPAHICEDWRRLGYPRIKDWGLRCRMCGPMILRIRETEPVIYRFCPHCGDRILTQDDASVAELDGLQIGAAPAGTARR